MKLFLIVIFCLQLMQCKTQVANDEVGNQAQEINSHASEGKVILLPTYQEVEIQFKKDFLDENPDTLIWLNQQSSDDQYLFWEEQFRKELVELYKDSNYVNSAFQEFAIRNLIKKNTLEIVFDQHGLDCGAPDCYANIYNIELDPKWEKFPDQFNFTMSLEGCVDLEILSQGVFRHVLTEEFASYYYAKELKQLLELDLDEEGVYKYARIHPEFTLKPNNSLKQIDARKSQIAKGDEMFDFYPYTSLLLGSRISYSYLYFEIQKEIFE